MPLPNPVIFVPGVTATNLRDLYRMPPDTVWSLLHKDYARAGLHPEDQRYEGQLPAQVTPDQVFEIAYREMILDLRHDLTRHGDRPVPVYIFGYDWRQPLAAAEKKLAAFIAEVTQKTALMGHYHADGYGAAGRRKVNLVGHSMGGLIITGYLAQAGAASPVQRVATIATPFRGSFQAVDKIVLGTTNRREREAARLSPSLYHLLPTVDERIAIAPTLPQKDMFHPKLWQKSVVETIQEALRLRGSGAVKPTMENAEKVLKRMLDEAKAYRAKTNGLKLADCGLTKDDWLSVIGVGDRTRVALRVDDSPEGPWFDLLSSEMFGDDEITDPQSWRTGDGTVSFEGALPAFETTRMVVSRKDFRFLEIREKLLDAAADLHGILPNMDKIQSRLRNHLSA